MQLKDARHLSPDAQEALRYRVVKAVENGMGKSVAARVFSVSRTAIHHWTKAVSEQTAIAHNPKLDSRQMSSLFKHD